VEQNDGLTLSVAAARNAVAIHQRMIGGEFG
jgi:hypothetical protein